MAQSNPFTIDTRKAVGAGQEIANQAEAGQEIANQFFIENQWYKANESPHKTGY